jgi:hypothetical protein
MGTEQQRERQIACVVYGASEGLRTLVIEPQAVGGQAPDAPTSLIACFVTKGFGVAP